MVGQRTVDQTSATYRAATRDLLAYSEAAQVVTADVLRRPRGAWTPDR